MGIPNLSFLDRFDALRGAARRISAGGRPDLILEALVQASRSLLRAPHTDLCTPEALSLPLLERAASSRQVCRLESPASELAAPVYAGEELWGVLHLSHPEVAHLFGPEEERLVQYLTMRAGTALSLVQRQARRRSALAALQGERDRLQTLFEASPVAMALVDEQGRTVLANQALEALTGGPVTSLPEVLQAGPGRAWTEGGVVRLRGPGEPVAQLSLTSLGPHRLACLPQVGPELGHELVVFLEQERQLLAAELHDGPGQTLALRGLGDEGSRRSLGRFGELLQWLRNPLLEGKSLGEIMAAYQVQMVEEDSPLPLSVGLVMFRCLQEALERSEGQASLSVRSTPPDWTAQLQVGGWEGDLKWHRGMASRCALLGGRTRLSPRELLLCLPVPA